MRASASTARSMSSQSGSRCFSRSGASSAQDPLYTASAAISAPMPNSVTPSWAMSSRLVFASNARIISL